MPLTPARRAPHRRRKPIAKIDGLRRRPADRPHLRGWLGQHAALHWFWSKQMKAQTPQGGRIITLSRELRAMGYRKLSARPRHHAQAEGAIEDFKKTSPRAWRQLRARRRLTATR